MDQSTEDDKATGTSREDFVMSEEFANLSLSPCMFVFKGTMPRYKASQPGTHLHKHSKESMETQKDMNVKTHMNRDKHASMNTDTGDDTTSKVLDVAEEGTKADKEKLKEEKRDGKVEEKGEVPEDETYCTRDEIIKINLTNHLLYISHCIKADDLIQYLPCWYSKEQISDILSAKSPLRASRKALEMLLHRVEGSGRFAALRDYLDPRGYPKIVKILDGEYDPEDKRFVRIVELFAPELIGFIKPSELLPHLLRKGVFEQIDVDEIKSEEANHGALRAACILLMYLPRRTVDWYRSFLDVLIDCDLENTAEMLDPDFFEDIMKERKQKKCHGIESIKHVISTPKRNKPKISPTPIGFRKDKDNGTIKSHGSNSESEDSEIEFTEFDEEELEYVLGNEKERKKLEDSMIYIDAKILWPEKSQGKKQRILLRSLSKDEYTDACVWSRKRKLWKQGALKIFHEIFGQVSRRKPKKPNVSKIITHKHKTADSSKMIYRKMPLPIPRQSHEKENTDLATGIEKEIEPEPVGEIVKWSEGLMACGRRISVMEGSIVDIGTDAIVRTTNKNLSFSTEMSETIIKQGGESISTACRKFIQRQSSIDEGETFVCDGGNLKAKYVFNVNSPVYFEGDDKEIKLLKQTVGRVLHQASLRKATSIAMPAIGCGHSGWHAKTVAPLIIDAVRNYFREEQESTLKHVYLIDVNDKIVKRFHEALLATFKDDSTCEIQP